MLQVESYNAIFNENALLPIPVLELALASLATADVYVYSCSDSSLVDGDLDRAKQVYLIDAVKRRQMLFIPVILPDDAGAALFAVDIAREEILVYSTQGINGLIDQIYKRVEMLATVILRKRKNNDTVWMRVDVSFAPQSDVPQHARVLLYLYADYQGRLDYGAALFADMKLARKRIAELIYSKNYIA